MIKPTIGRKVWFYAGTAVLPGVWTIHNSGDETQPMDATVVYVHGDRMVNLAVLDHAGEPHAVRSVHLVQPGDEAVPNGMRAEWMPYQVGQAKKDS